jgi:DNA topoisomerase-1
LIRELENRGIGRPATFAAIVDTILRREYVRTEKGRLAPTPLGEKAVAFLNGAFSFIDYDFTKEMESSLDGIAGRKADYADVLGKAYERLQAELGAFASRYGVSAERTRREPETTAFTCIVCGKPLVHMQGQKRDGSGKYDFFSCSDRNCNASYPNEDGKPGEARKKPEPTKYKCKSCGKPLVHMQGQKRDGSGEYDFFSCSDRNCNASYPNEDGKPGEARKKLEPTKYKCKSCGKPLVRRESAKGPFFGCSGFPSCKRLYQEKDGKPDFGGKKK